MTKPDVDTRDRVTAWLLGEFPGLAQACLPWQRWFGGKARTIEAVDIEDVIWLPLEAPPCALVAIDVRYAKADHGLAPRERYAMVIGIADDPRGCPTIARLSWQPGLRVIEATTDGLVLHALLRGLPAEARLHGERGGTIVYADASGDARRLLTDGPEGLPAIAPVGLEQSNTSVRVGATHVFKLFRRLEDGENPQLEIGRFLMRANFRAVPPLEGSLVYRGPRGDACALGALEGWVDNQGDGWRYMLARLEQSAHEPTAARELAADMRTLGTTTADFHAALASDSHLEAFAPEPVTSQDSHAWRRQVLAQAERTFDLIEQHVAGWPEPAAGLGRSLVDARHTVAQALRGLEGRPLEIFQKIRIHGDFHLGQTLKTPAGFSIIDFEGEPAKPLAERRQKHCVLRDVAGMVRSLEYAAATVRARVRDAAEDAFSVSSLRDAFVGAYRARAMALHATFLPPSPETLDPWLRFFELEKALYEVEYEVNNRPDWIHIPLRAVVRLLTEPADTNGSFG
jgi:maltose alpha-D-glucosyltransferase/alpha-amylase